MRPYLAAARGVFQEFVTYRFTTFATLVGNVLYMGLLRYLWGSIYADRDVIGGLTFDQAFLYIALAGSVFLLFKTYTDWWVSHQIRSGDIVGDLTKPVDFQLLRLAESAGLVVSNLAFVSAPSVLVLFAIYGGRVDIGIGMAFLPVALVLAFLISYSLDYLVGLTSFYTQSIWGLSTYKEVITSALSGALLPLPFFPDWAQRILLLLPFQAVYHVPLTLVTSGDLKVSDCLNMMAVQAFWVVVLFIAGRLFFRRAVKVVTVAGG